MRKGIRRAVLGFLGASLFAVPLAARPAAGVHARTAASPVELRISAGRLTLKADNVSVGEVLRRVAQASRSRLSLTSEAAARVGHWDLRDVPIADALAEIARPSNIVIVLSPDWAGGDDSPIREIHVFGAPGSEVGEAGPPPVEPTKRLPELVQALGDETDQAARLAAVRELGEIGTAESVGALEKALGDADSRVLVEVIRSLGRTGTNDAIRLVGQAALGTRDPEVRAAAIRVLEESSSDNAGMLLAAVRDRVAVMSAASRPSADLEARR